MNQAINDHWTHSVPSILSRSLAPRHSSPTRLLMTTDASGSLFDYSAELARQFSEVEMQVVLVVMDAPLGAWQKKLLSVASHVRWIEICEVHAHLSSPDAIRNAQAHELLNIERWLSPDLVHLNHFGFTSLPWRAPKLLTMLDMDLPSGSPEMSEQKRARILCDALDADLVVTPEERTLGTLLSQVGGSCRGRVIPNRRGMTAAYLAAYRELIDEREGQPKGKIRGRQPFAIVH